MLIGDRYLSITERIAAYYYVLQHADWHVVHYLAYRVRAIVLEVEAKGLNNPYGVDGAVCSIHANHLRSLIVGVWK